MYVMYVVYRVRRGLLNDGERKKRGLKLTGAAARPSAR
jgi:hypothetical protein